MSGKMWYERRRKTAIRLMRHYLRESFNFQWSPDNDAEIELLVDAIVDTAIYKIIIELQEEG